jgi:hypothetical protein
VKNLLIPMLTISSFVQKILKSFRIFQEKDLHTRIHQKITTKHSVKISGMKVFIDPIHGTANYKNN